ncbi:MAG: hypothetical protein IT318_23265 [Anaerolineales bacterium]|nr:hypothetical protein [Anaerolineales bacterium]
MQPTPSLLDWLRFKLGRPRVQRAFRFGLAGLALLLGLAQLLTSGGQAVGAFFFLGAGIGLGFWGLSVRPARGPEFDLPELGLGARPAPAAAIDLTTSAESAAASRARRRQILASLWLPSALLLAAWGQGLLINGPELARPGAALLALGALVFASTLFLDRLLGAPRALAVPQERPLTFRWWLLAVGVVGGVYAFLAAGGNQFRLGGVIAWIISVAAWLGAVWEWPMPAAEIWKRVQRRAAAVMQPDGLQLRLSWLAMAFLAVLAVGAYFRFAQLASIPPEMTSDHVEKLFDVNDLLGGQRRVFFERNTGREPLQFYFAALVIRWLGTGLTMLTLKITSAVAGFLMLPFLFWLGRELEDDLLGLLAMLLAGVGFWATAISRVGLRFPLTPLFVAPMLLFFLRGARRGGRNDFLLSGLFLGLGLYGYSTIRMAPVLIMAAAVWLLMWPPAGITRRALVGNTVLLFATAFVVFVPLYRYATEPDNLFWYRSFSRLSGAEQAINGSPLRIFLSNNWNALRMFNYTGDDVWVNTLPGKPVLDFITGALFVLGAVFLLARLIWRRDRIAGLLLLAIPILLLPSTLSVAFPEENPSVVRGGGAIPVVFLIAAYPLWLLWQHERRLWPSARGRWLAAGGLGLLLLMVTLANREMYFRRYPAQYIGSAQNASEIGRAVRDFAESIGSYDRAWICLHPHWADTRAVGLYAGRAGWEQVLPAEELTSLSGDPRPLLLVINPRSDACLAAARSAFPTGTLSLFQSQRGTDKDFLLFFVPGTQDLDEGTLPYE